MTGGVEHRKITVGNSDLLIVFEYFIHQRVKARLGINGNTILFFQMFNAAGVVKMVMRDDYLIHWLFPHAGVDLFDLINNVAICAGIDNSVHIIKRIPGPEQQVHFAGVA